MRERIEVDSDRSAELERENIGKNFRKGSNQLKTHSLRLISEVSGYLYDDKSGISLSEKVKIKRFDL